MTEPVAFAALGDDVFIGDGDNLARWTENGGIQGLTVTPQQYMKFNGGYMVDPEPAEAEKAVAAYNADPPDFEALREPRVSPNFSDPDVLDMRGPHLRGIPATHDDNFYKATRLPDGSIHVQARAVDEETGIVGHINKVVAPDDPDYERFAATVTDTEEG